MVTVLRYAGDDVAVDMEMDLAGAADAELLGDGIVLSMLTVGGTSFVGTDSLSGGASEDGGLPDHVEWIELEASRDAESFAGVFVPITTADELFGTFDSSTAAIETSPQEIDGVRYRAFDLDLAVDEVEELLGGGTDDAGDEGWEAVGEVRDAEGTARYDSIEQFGREHSGAQVQVLVDDEGRLRRISIELVNDVPAEFADCALLADARTEGTIVMDVTELGAVTIDAPDPAAVMTESEADALYEASDDAEFEGTFGSDEDLLETSDGGWPREALELELSLEGATPATDLATLQTMTEEALVAAWEERLAVEATLPRTETVFGDQTRSEMLGLVRAGMEREGVDPSMADGLTDEQLAELIDTYLRSEALPGSSADDSYDEFEGCPE